MTFDQPTTKRRSRRLSTFPAWVMRFEPYQRPPRLQRQVDRWAIQRECWNRYRAGASEESILGLREAHGLGVSRNVLYQDLREVAEQIVAEHPDQLGEAPQP